MMVAYLKRTFLTFSKSERSGQCQGSSTTLAMWSVAALLALQRSSTHGLIVFLPVTLRWSGL